MTRYVSTPPIKRPKLAFNGIAVYTPSTIREFMVPVVRKSGVDFKTGILHVDYTTPGDTKTTKYAEADFNIDS